MPAPRSTADLSTKEARRIALAAQGFASPRPGGRIDIRHLRRVVSHVGIIQIDTVNVVVRSQYMPLFSRLGPYPLALLDDAAYRRRELFETVAHELSLIPIEHYPLLRHRLDAGVRYKWTQRWAAANRGYIERVLEEVRRKGPLSPDGLEDQGARFGTFWMTSQGKAALNWLLKKGLVMVRERRNFARVYDLTERVLPAAVRRLPAPDETAAQRELLLLAARSLGVGTARDLADYYRLAVAPARRLLAQLVEDGELRTVSVEGWREPAFLHPGARAPRSVEARTLLTPFDSLIWERERTERLFGFRYRIEIYVPEKQREFGYYVLPFLLDERLVARVDLKADRARSELLVRGAFVEDGESPREVAEALAEELRLMAGWLGLERVSVGRRGNLAKELREALRKARPRPRGVRR